MWCGSMWMASRHRRRRRCVRFTGFFIRFYRIRGILMSSRWTVCCVAHALYSLTYRRFISCSYTVYTHTHMASNNSIVLYYNDGLKFFFVIFFSLFFH